MNYDLKELSERVRERRERFLTTVIFELLGILVSLALAIVFPETTVVFICVCAALLLVYFAIRAIRKFQPLILFRKELRGVNIKEHEYVTLVQSHMRASRYLGYYKGRYNQTASAKGVRAMVYLRLSDGNVTVIDGLHKSHVDIYEEGDELIVHEGAKYPVIISRDVKKQPCPICGEINSKNDTRCSRCGLGTIVK